MARAEQSLGRALGVTMPVLLYRSTTAVGPLSPLMRVLVKPGETIEGSEGIPQVLILFVGILVRLAEMAKKRLGVLARLVGETLAPVVRDTQPTSRTYLELEESQAWGSWILKVKHDQYW